MTDRITFYKKVKLICRIKGRKLPELEKKIGVSPGYLSRCKVSIDKAYVIAQELNMTIDEIFNFEPKTPSICAYCGKPLKEKEDCVINNVLDICVTCPTCRRVYTIKPELV